MLENSYNFQCQKMFLKKAFQLYLNSKRHNFLKIVVYEMLMGTTLELQLLESGIILLAISCVYPKRLLNSYVSQRGEGGIIFISRFKKVKDVLGWVSMLILDFNCIYKQMLWLTEYFNKFHRIIGYKSWIACNGIC